MNGWDGNVGNIIDTQPRPNSMHIVMLCDSPFVSASKRQVAVSTTATAESSRYNVFGT
jgi:hypothetical protein